MSLQKGKPESDNINPAIKESIDTTGAVVYVINPKPETFEEIREYLTELTDRPTVRVLGNKDVLDKFTEDFLRTAKAVNLEVEDELEFRVTDNTIGNLVIGTSLCTSLIEVGGKVVGTCKTSDAETVDETWAELETVWDNANEYSHRTPAYEELIDELASHTSEDVAKDFDELLHAHQDVVPEEGDRLSPPELALAVGCRNEVLLYDISHWAEYAGLSSKATMSRNKTKWEDLGMIDTSKVQKDIGRPRLRLQFADDELNEYDNEELLTHLYDMQK
jgi:hypothetical protein